MSYALILAAGRGERFGGETPKQYAELLGKTVLQRAVDLFEAVPEVSGYGLLVPGDDVEHVRTSVLRGRSGSGRLWVRAGGESRRETVRIGLEALESRDPRTVFVHDAARPAARPELVQRILKRWEQRTRDLAGLVPSVPVADTVKRVDPESGNLVEETLPRDQLRAVQTPQFFDFPRLLRAHRTWDESVSATDDAMMLEEQGEAIGLVEGHPENRKLTRKSDLPRLVQTIRRREED